ncbi:MAG: 1,4-dihydroxy-2-naphthoate prenyltransferase [Glaciihabitans sp.]|nr:1,4-dihydroxy-2-naphthoate prenyltransferase [Glaciihabitans sp.]
MPSKPVALALSTHPGPAVAVTLITVILGAGVGLPPERIVLLGLAMLANQASVGLSNDWIDAERDRLVGRRDKPVARGWISVPAVRLAAWLSAAAAVALTVPLGWAAVAAQVVFITSAWLYNAGLKNTVASVVPYIVSFGVLPLLVTLALPHPAAAAWWAMAAGAALGIAAHFANVLPDLEDDHRTGVRGLPHRLGRRSAGIATYGVLVAASLLVVVGPASAPGVAGWIGLGATAAIAVVGITLVLTRPPTRLLFQLIILAAVVDVVLLALAGRAVVI